MLGKVFLPLGRTDCPEHTMGWVPRAKNKVPAVGLGPRASMS